MPRPDPRNRRLVSKMDLASTPKELAADSKKLLKEILEDMIRGDMYGSARLRTVADLKDLEVMLDKMDELHTASTETTTKAEKPADETTETKKADPKTKVEPALKTLTLDEFNSYAVDRLMKAVTDGDAKATDELQKQIAKVRNDVAKFEDTEIIRVQVYVDPDYTGPTTEATPSADQGAPAAGGATTKAAGADDKGEAKKTKKADGDDKDETKKADHVWPVDLNDPDRSSDWGKDPAPAAE